MTSIGSLPPVAHVLPNVAPAGNRAAATVAGRDFPALLKAQSHDIAPPPSPAGPPAPADPATAMARRPDIEAMLQQMFASRKVSLHVGSRVGRSGAATAASGPALPDCSIADEPPVDCAAPAIPACTDEYSTVPCPEHGAPPAAWAGIDCGNGLIAGVPVECPLNVPLNVPLTAVGQPASIFIWTPVETIRTPLQAVRERLRRRKRLSAGLVEEPKKTATRRWPKV